MTGPNRSDKPAFAEIPADPAVGMLPSRGAELDQALELLRDAVLILDDHGLSQAAAYADMARHVLMRTRSEG